MKLLNKLKEKKGFTLIESMVSIAILAIATTVFAVFMATTSKMTTYTLQNEKDYQILQEVIATGKVPEGSTIVLEEVKPEKNATNLDNFTISIKITGCEEIKLSGKYVIVKNPETNQSFTIFVGDKITDNKGTQTNSTENKTDVTENKTDSGSSGGENANP